MIETHPPKHDPFKPVLMLLLATAGWGFSFPLMKALVHSQTRLLPGANEWFITAQSLTVRFGLATALMAVVCWSRLRRIGRLEWKLGVGLGLFAGAGTMLQMVGLGHTLASTSAFLTQGYVLILPVWLAVWQRRWPSRFLVISSVLVIIGMGVLCRVDWRNFSLGRGEWLTLGAAVIFVGDILWLDRREFHAADKFTATLLMFVTMFVMFIPLIWWTRPASGVTWLAYREASVWVTMAGLVAVPTLLSFTLMNVWQPFIAPTHAGLIYCAEPVCASVYALWLPGLLAQYGRFEYPNEALTASLWIGGALITLANVLVQYDR